MTIVYNSQSSYGVTDEQLQNHNFIGSNFYDPATGMMSINIGKHTVLLSTISDMMPPIGGDHMPPKPIIPPQPSEE